MSVPLTLSAAPASGYAKATAELFALHGRGVKLGLENIRVLLDGMGSPDQRYRIVQVAGTNGKGSTASYLAAGLRAAGLRVGLFTSPHLVDFRERVQVDGEPIGEADVVRGWSEIRAEVDRLRMTFFEANTAIAVDHFARKACDVAVLETGMGGRLDATTATNVSLCVLTRIAFDHRDYLGKTLGAIAAEKAAILGSGARGFSAPQMQDAERAILEAARRSRARLVFVGRPGDVRVTAEGTEFRWRGERLRLRMVGRHQAQNALLALEVLAELLPEVPPRLLAQAVEPVEVPGRFQRVERPSGTWVLDVAHNPDAVGCFARALRQAYPQRPKRAFLAMLRDKDLAGSLSALGRARDLQGPVLVGCAASAPDSRRLRRKDWLRVPEDRRAGGVWVGAVPEGLARLESWQTRTPDGITAVVGSFTSVGEVMRSLGIDPLSA